MCAQAEGTGKAPPGTAFIPTPGDVTSELGVNNYITSESGVNYTWETSLVNQGLITSQVNLGL